MAQHVTMRCRYIMAMDIRVRVETKVEGNTETGQKIYDENTDN